jgi:hypothetical protein
MPTLSEEQNDKYIKKQQNFFHVTASRSLPLDALSVTKNEGGGLTMRKATTNGV